MIPIQIIATIGPACNKLETIQAMVAAGMNVARLNFSWGTHDEHAHYIELVRTAAEREGVRVPIMQDISGPRIQTGSTHTFADNLPVLTEKDRADVVAMVPYGVDYIAQSFVRSVDDIEDLRIALQEHNATSQVIAKIERQEAVNNLDSLIQAADGIMIARGDLGDAVPYYTLPFVKKDILQRCHQRQTPVIVATEMLTSMIDDTDPSRADISDIAHAVLDGASATMLSNETAVGTNPVAVVEVMRAVVDEAVRHAQVANHVRF